MELRRLNPEPAAVTVDAVLADLDAERRAPDSRPHVALNMISTLDGKAAVEGRTAPMGSAADRALFHGLRAHADAVMVGAGTLRTERYGRIIKDPAVRERRQGAGLPPEPLACLVSGRLDLPPDLPLLQEPEARVVVITSSDDELPDVRAAVEYLRADPLQLEPLMAHLHAEHGVRKLLCEGGPTLNEHLLAEGLVDELFLSLAPMLVGGRALTIVTGTALEGPVELEPIWCLESEGHLFTRWRVDRPA